MSLELFKDPLRWKTLSKQELVESMAFFIAKLHRDNNAQPAAKSSYRNNAAANKTHEQILEDITKPQSSDVKSSMHVRYLRSKYGVSDKDALEILKKQSIKHIDQIVSKDGMPIEQYMDTYL